MTTHLLLERPLNDDVLHIADSGKIFSGGYVAYIEYFTYANSWNDTKHYKRFRSIETMQNYVNKKYPGVEL